VAYYGRGAAYARCILGRFLPKLGGIGRCRHFFQVGMGMSIKERFLIQTDAVY
jgi:hypothetical protein